MRNKTLRAKNVSFIFYRYTYGWMCVCFFLSFVPSVSLLFSINDFPFSIASRHDQFIFGALALHQPTYVCIYIRLKPSQLKTERLAKHFEYICACTIHACACVCMRSLCEWEGIERYGFQCSSHWLVS